jgi:hypothetical protein
MTSKIPDEPEKPHTQRDAESPEIISNPKTPDEAQKEALSSKSDTPPKESYEDYIKSLPPPYWESRKPPLFNQTNSPPPRRQQDRSAQEIAASINAVCAPITAADREEDAKRRARTFRERWKDWRNDREKLKSEVDIRPMEKGSSARLNVWGSPLTERKKR